MKLLSAANWKSLPPLGTHDRATNRDIPVHVKLYTPDGPAAWYVIEGDRGTGRLYCLCNDGSGLPRMAIVSLRELETVRGRRGLHVKRDTSWEGTLDDAYHEVRT